jgi:nucleoside-diphosphate-sugar epimerase
MDSSGASSHRALVAGAGGYLGRAIVAALRDDGWTVRGLVHRVASTGALERVGAEAVVGDVLDPRFVTAAARGCELLVHVAASGNSDALEDGTAERVRVEGCRNLLRAGIEAKSRRLLVGSGYWVYADQANPITEESTVNPRGESLVNWNTERVALDPRVPSSMEVVVVRPGMVYGNGSWFRSMVNGILEGSYEYVGAAANPWSFVSLEDAGRGFATIARSGRSGEVYNLVDGRPAPWKEFGDAVAERLARSRPPSISPEAASARYGPDVAYHLQARRACSSAKLEQLDWRPRYLDYRDGLTALLPQMAGGSSPKL